MARIPMKATDIKPGMVLKSCDSPTSVTVLKVFDSGGSLAMLVAWSRDGRKCRQAFNLANQEKGYPYQSWSRTA